MTEQELDRRYDLLEKIEIVTGICWDYSEKEDEYTAEDFTLYYDEKTDTFGLKQDYMSDPGRYTGAWEDYYPEEWDERWYSGLSLDEIGNYLDIEA